MAEYLSTDPNAGAPAPKYLSTDPNAGNAAPTKGDQIAASTPVPRRATEAELNPPAPPPTNIGAKLMRLGEGAYAPLEVATSLGTGMLGQVVGPAVGIGRRLFGGSIQDSAKTASDVARAVTYEPRSETGQAAMELISNFMDESKLGGMAPTASGRPMGVDRFSKITKKLTSMEPEIPARPAVGVGAERVIGHLQGIRDTVESKVSGRIAGAQEKAKGVLSEAENKSQSMMAKAEQDALDMVKRAEAKGGDELKAAQDNLERVRAERLTEPTATPGELGSTAQIAADIRKTELEALRESEKQLLFDALDSGVQVNISGIPKQIDLMLVNEKNPDVIRALKSAKKTLYTKIGNGKGVTETPESIMLEMRKFKVGSPEYYNLSQKLQTIDQTTEQKPVLDTSMKGLDSARNAIKAIMSNSDDPAARYASAQLGQVVRMLEKGMSDASPEYGQFLKKWSERSAPLDIFKSGRVGSAVDKQAFTGEFSASPESIGNKFFRAGDEGAAAAREFKTAVNDNPEAIQSMVAYVSGKLRDTPPDKWGAFLKKYDSALKEFGAYDKLKAYEQNALGAVKGVESTADIAKRAVEAAKVGGKDVMSSAKAIGKQELDAAKESAAGIIGSAKQREKNIGEAISNSVIGKLTDTGKGVVLPQGQDAFRRLTEVFSGKDTIRDLKQLVSATSKDPAVLQGLRDDYFNFLVKDKAVGDVPDYKTFLNNWEKTREAVTKSGLMTPEHAATFQKVADDINAALNKEPNRFQRSASSIAYGIGSLFNRGYQAARATEIVLSAEPAAVRAQNVLLDRVMKLSADPEVSKLLAAPPTPENVKRLQVMLPADIAETLTPMLARAAQQPPPEEQRRRRNPLSMQPVVP